MRAFIGCGGGCVLWRVIFGDVFVQGWRVGVGLVWFGFRAEDDDAVRVLFDTYCELWFRV